MPKTCNRLPGVLLIVLSILMLPAPTRAQDPDGVETRVQVRVLARDAKLIGDAVGGARVTIRHAGTGALLAEGITRGSTGDTDLIIREPAERGEPRFGTPGAAGWLARFRLDRVTPVTITSEGPLDYPQARAQASKTLFLTPGADLLGDGVVLELHGFIVEILEGGEGSRPGGDGSFPVQARVRMLCSCPTEPDGLWTVEQVTARLLSGEGSVVGETEMEFTGETSVYGGELEAPAPGTYVLEIVASDPATENFGLVRQEVDVAAPR